jgi:hypothetical protein
LAELVGIHIFPSLLFVFILQLWLFTSILEQFTISNFIAAKGQIEMWSNLVKSERLVVHISLINLFADVDFILSEADLGII